MNPVVVLACVLLLANPLRAEDKAERMMIFKVPKTGTTSLAFVLGKTLSRTALCYAVLDGYMNNVDMMAKYKSLPSSSCLWKCEARVYFSHYFRHPDIVADVIDRCRIDVVVVPVRRPLVRFTSEVYYQKIVPYSPPDILVAYANASVSPGGAFNPYSQYSPLGLPDRVQSICLLDIADDGRGMDGFPRPTTKKRERHTGNRSVPHRNITPDKDINMPRAAFEALLQLYTEELRWYEKLTEIYPYCTAEATEFVF